MKLVRDKECQGETARPSGSTGETSGVVLPAAG